MEPERLLRTTLEPRGIEPVGAALILGLVGAATTECVYLTADPAEGATGLATGFLGTTVTLGFDTFVQSPQSTTELVKTFEEKFMLPDFPALLLQAVAADATCRPPEGTQKVIAKVAKARAANSEVLGTEQN